jgi:hypothetical protein
MMNYKILAAATLAAIVAQAGESTIRPTDGSWEKHGFQPAANACTTGVDTQLEAMGTPNLAIDCEPAESGGVVINQMFSASAYVGKRVRWSAMIRTSDVQAYDITGGFARGANISMRADKGDSRNTVTMLVEAYAGDPGLSGDTDWVPAQIVTDVPLEATTITTGFMLSGSGKAWLKEPSFEIVGYDVPVTTLPLSVTRSSGPNLQLR